MAVLVRMHKGLEERHDRGRKHSLASGSAIGAGFSVGFAADEQEAGGGVAELDQAAFLAEGNLVGLRQRLAGQAAKLLLP